jgi:hypothetical protein
MINRADFDLLYLAHFAASLDARSSNDAKSRPFNEPNALRRAWVRHTGGSRPS